jgi:hypothetical protein
MALKYSTVGGGSGTGFNVQIGSKYSYAAFTSALPAGAYTIKSSNNYTNWDVYLLGADGSLIAYSGTASISPTAAFSAIVVVNGTINDILQFSYQTTVFSTAETNNPGAAPAIVSISPTGLPNANSILTVTGVNFTGQTTATFTGIDNIPRTAASVNYNSPTSLSVTRPITFPVVQQPYTLSISNPGVSDPITSNVNKITGITAGGVPYWSTAATLSFGVGSSVSQVLLAIDPDAGALTYSYVSGTLPTGLSFNASTATISGTAPATTGSTTYTVRATDIGNNSIDQTFTISIVPATVSGGTLTSDSTYYYRTFTANSNLVVTNAAINLDILSVAGGGGGGGQRGGGGGAGGVFSQNTTLSPNTYSLVIGGGGSGSAPGGGTQGSDGSLSQFAALTSAVGGGGGGGDGSPPAGRNGGSGGGACNYTGAAAGTGTSGQGFAGGTTSGNSNYYGAAGGGGGGGVGGTGTSGGPGAGGTGSISYSAWISAITSGMTGISGWGSATSGGYIAGGGAGGYYGTNADIHANGGAGGGGNGHIPSNGSSATDAYGKTNTGGGGGGGTNGTSPYSDSYGGTGGSGLIVVRYTKASVGG